MKTSKGKTHPAQLNEFVKKLIDLIIIKAPALKQFAIDKILTLIQKINNYQRYLFTKII